MVFRAHLRSTLDVAKVPVEWEAGLRAAVSMLLPLAAGAWLGRPELVWAGLGGWLAVLADPGGAYAIRARTLLVYALFGSLAFMAGALVSYSLWIAAPALFLCSVACSLTRVRGDAAGVLGVLVLIAFCITLGTAAPLPLALEHAALHLAGALLAVVLTLALWPFQPYRPTREAVAAAWRALGDVAASIGGPWEQQQAARAAARAALENARLAVVASRVGRQAQTRRGEELVVLYELAEAMLGDLAALAEVQGEARGVREKCAQIADDIEFRDGEKRAPATTAAEATGAGPATPLLTRVQGGLAEAAACAAALRARAGAPRAPQALPEADRWPSVRDTLARDSVELKHALRTAIVTTVGLLAGTAAHLPRTHWVTITIVIVLQPHAVATVRRVLHRVAGTVLGALAAAVIGRYLRTPEALLPVLFVLSVAAVAIRRVNYAAYAALLTPVFVLLAESSAGDWHLTSVRIYNTLIGGALGLGGALLLWPTRELSALPHRLAEVVLANRAYLRARLIERDAQRAAAARRGVGLAAANAEAALQRLLAERDGPARAEPFIAAVAHARRLTASITAVAALAPETPLAAPGDEALAAFAAAAHARTAPPDPVLPEPRNAPERSLAQQLRLLQGALKRAAQ